MEENLILSLPHRHVWFEKGELFLSQKWGENVQMYMDNFGIPGHNGLDFVGVYGDDILASHDGDARIIWDGEHSTKGNGVYIKTPTFETVYWHLSKITIEPGPVKRGQKIGEMGNAGFVRPIPTPENPTAGTHLHYGLRPLPAQANGFDGYIDPWPYLICNTKNMLKLYGNSQTKEQYIKSYGGVLHRIANQETLNDLHEAEVINKDAIVWLGPNEFSVYTIGKVWLSYNDQ